MELFTTVLRRARGSGRALQVAAKGAVTAAVVAAAGICAAAAKAQTVVDQIPRPSGNLVPGEGVVWFGMFNLGLMAAAFLAMFYVAFRTRSVLPLFFLAGGALAAFVQPVFDGNIHVEFAKAEQAPNWYFYNVGYPWFVVPGNAMMGALVYFMYSKFRDGISVKGLWIAFFGFWMFNNCWEVPGTNIGSYAYFGPHPFKFLGYPLWIGMMAGLGLPLAGFAAYAARKYLEGPMMYLTIVVLIPIAIYGSEVTTWPMWITLNGGGTVAIAQWAAALSLVFVLVFYNLMVQAYTKGREAPVAKA